MAKPEGIIRLKGRLGNTVTYTLEGQEVTRTIGRVNKEAYKSAPNFAAFRNNGTEFGASSYYGKTIRQVLAPFMHECFGPYVSGRLSGKIRNMILEGKGAVGRRSLEVEQLAALNGFPLQRRYPKRAFFCTEKPLRISREKGELTLALDRDELACAWGQKLKAHQSLSMGIMALSGLHYKDGYELLYPEWHGRVAFTNSGRFEELSEQGRLVLKAKLPLDEPLPAGVGLVGIVGFV